MAVLKTRAKHHNGTGFDTFHYETQAKQVKILDANGVEKSNLDEMILKGKSVTGVSLSTLTDTGLYQVRDCTDAPFTMVAGKVYKLSVESVAGIVTQEFYDELKSDTHSRHIYNGSKGSWASTGLSEKTKLNNLSAVVGDHLQLTTVQKGSLVAAVNSLKTEVESGKTKSSSIETNVSQLSSNLSGHNHDSIYFKIAGGDLTGSPTTPNNAGFQGKNTSGARLNIGKVDASNKVSLGDTTASGVVINAKSGDLTLNDGLKSVKVFHGGNMGSGSGLDADSVDGVEGVLLARRDIRNYFLEDQYIDSGKSLQMRAATGASNAGSIFFRDGTGLQKGRVLVDVNGNMHLHGGTTVGLSIKSDGGTETFHDHVMNARDRQVALRFKLNEADKGAGFYMNANSKQVGFFDWEYGSWFFTTDRADQVVKFRNEIMVQGKRLNIQASAPTSPATGDIWFDI